jgi:hypothetical protein
MKRPPKVEMHTRDQNNRRQEMLWQRFRLEKVAGGGVVGLRQAMGLGFRIRTVSRSEVRPFRDSAAKRSTRAKITQDTAKAQSDWTLFVLSGL